MAYSSSSEEDIKTEIANAFFPASRFKAEKNRLDFAVSDKFGGAPLYWAESKKGSAVSKWTMLAQLLLTIKPRIDKGETPPKFIGCFDCSQITFVAFYDAQAIFAANDFNWKEKPSAASRKTSDNVEKILAGKERTFDWRKDGKVVAEFVKKAFPKKRGTKQQMELFQPESPFIQIDKNNFVQIFNRWRENVLPTIIVPDELAREGIIGGDFYLADLLSENGRTLSQNLKILLNGCNYELNLERKLFERIEFKDKGKAHADFWRSYIRPPKKEYQGYILNRRDLLVPSNIRERKGAFFTPQIWVEKSQQYLAEVFGENWQDEYYIWDCCAGTGNLEEGLSNPERVWVSTLDEPDVRVMRENPRLLKSHVFRFDFLNGCFDSLPDGLKKIIGDPEKCRKLIIYINPPYAEATNAKTSRGTGQNKAGVARTAQNRYEQFIGKAANEIFAQFIARIHAEIFQLGERAGHLAMFSTLKYLSGSNFAKFREWWRGGFKKGFVVRADTFDNVKGQFPIGFLIWDMAERKEITSVKCDVLENDGEKIGVKRFYADSSKSINEWISTCKKEDGEPIGNLFYRGNDFQNQNYIYISLNESIAHDSKLVINRTTLIPASIYFAVRHCIAADWLNDRDQFLYPNDGWKSDGEFQNDCLMFTIFHAQNRIGSAEGTNHWIPFKPSEVGAADEFDSGFMADFLHERKFSPEAAAVLSAGREVWRYYHSSEPANINASLYEIREHFRGRSDSGRLASKSGDPEFQALDDELRAALRVLAGKIAEKACEYGFLRK